ncbi:XdhC family protein [Streptomyces sp. NPDC005065]|uniref:XdhC family protein n=1 Tax=unclassified Streptomyces TaxID=2593676 RepID=UPI0033AAD7B2
MSSPTTPRSASPCCAGRLPSPSACMGAMGSCHTHQQRLQLLRETGAPELHLTRLRCSVGLDLRAHPVWEDAFPELASRTWAAAWRTYRSCTRGSWRM